MMGSFPVCRWCLAVVAVACLPALSIAQSAHFAVGGRCISYDGNVVQSIASTAGTSITSAWGTLADGRVAVNVGGLKSAVGADPSGAIKPSGGQLVLVSPDGNTSDVIASDVLRTYPSPSGDALALVSTPRKLSIWRDGKLTAVQTSGCVSMAAWSPDARHLVLTMYPEDWSPQAVDNAKTTVDFLRLQQSRLVLVDAGNGAPIADLTTEPGTNYGAFFSADGNDLFYIWLHTTENRGGLMKLTLDRDNHTSASAPAVQLTSVPGTPLGRVGTYVWTQGGTQLVFEAGMPDGSGVLWKMHADGTQPEQIGPGRRPQLITGGRVAYIQPNGVPAVLDAALKPEVAR